MLGLINKVKTKANGKIIEVDFKKLNPDDFRPFYNLTKEQIKNEYVLVSVDGKIYVNFKKAGYEIISGTFENFILETRNTIEQYLKIYQPQFPDINDFDDWAKMDTDNSQRMLAFGVLIAPLELKRREIERAYYTKIRTV